VCPPRVPASGGPLAALAAATDDLVAALAAARLAPRYPTLPTAVGFCMYLRRAALMDLGAVGWRPALEPIRRTFAENSLKLIALRGLVEHGRDSGSGSEADSDDEALLMAMDALL
jgi:hypothetical protein